MVLFTGPCQMLIVIFISAGVKYISVSDYFASYLRIFWHLTLSCNEPRCQLSPLER